SDPDGLCGDTYNKAGGVELPIVMIRVSQSDSADADAPIIYGLRPKATVVQAGEDATIFFEAIETRSGFQGGSSTASGWFEPAEEVRADSGSRNLTFGGSFTSTVVPAPELGPNWYALTFKVGPYKTPGIY